MLVVFCNKNHNHEDDYKTSGTGKALAFEI